MYGEWGGHVPSQKREIEIEKITGEIGSCVDNQRSYNKNPG